LTQPSANRLKQAHNHKFQNSLADRTFEYRITGYEGDRYLSFGLTVNDEHIKEFDAVNPDEIVQIMKEIFQKSVADALPEFVYSPDKPHKFFPIAVSIRESTTAQAPNGTWLFVEGDAARKPNFLTGSGLNVGLLGVKYYEEEQIFQKIKKGEFQMGDLDQKGAHSKRLHDQLVNKANDKCFNEG